ncbi:hypothetical protein BpHYR1_024224 [Brachionus plicatilis]|uniref:Uncharacterized protein n=1 Tax=Brachionus plicatilis TaxID=10195 RepID=A0A3M7PD96_BRAPC|nr:hypothetical protein BpHYR1_024224 [Brachionus plicatilis]
MPGKSSPSSIWNVLAKLVSLPDDERDEVENSGCKSSKRSFLNGFRATIVVFTKSLEKCLVHLLVMFSRKHLVYLHFITVFSSLDVLKILSSIDKKRLTKKKIGLQLFLKNEPSHTKFIISKFAQSQHFAIEFCTTAYDAVKILD